MSLFPLIRAILLPWFQPKVDLSGLDHLPTSGGYILAPNHVDWLDGFYLTAALNREREVRVKFLTASNNYWWTGVAIQIPILHNDVIERAVQELKRGSIVCNFPEGQRNFTSTLLPGKTGTIRMAAEAGVPVIPVGVRCQPGQTFMDSIRQVRQSDHRVAITFGAPLVFPAPAAGYSHEWLTAETARLMAAIAPLAGKGI